MGGAASSEQAEDLTKKLDKLNEQLEVLNQGQVGARQRRMSRRISAEQQLSSPGGGIPTPTGGGARARHAGFTFGGAASATTTPTPPQDASSTSVTLVPAPPPGRAGFPRDVGFEEGTSPNSKNKDTVEKAHLRTDKRGVALVAKQKRSDFFQPLFAMKQQTPPSPPATGQSNNKSSSGSSSGGGGGDGAIPSSSSTVVVAASSGNQYNGGSGSLPLQWQEIPKMPGVKCVWLNCAALALSYVGATIAATTVESGNKDKTTTPSVTVESLLRANQLALHLVSFPSVTLAELFDIVAEFVENDSTMLKNDIRAEVVTLESEILDDDEEVATGQGTGDGSPILNLTSFRKEIATELANPNSVFIFNYNPFFVQESESMQRRREEEEEEDEDEEADDGSEAAAAARLAKRAARIANEPPVQWAGLKNMGTFSILVDFNATHHSVTLATPHLTPENKFTLELHTCSLGTLYQATRHPDGYTKRPRGFVKIFKADNNFEPPVKSMFPVSTIDGRNTKGLLSVGLDIAIAPHVLGLGILHHLACAAGIIKVHQESQSLPSRRKSMAVGALVQSPNRKVTTNGGGNSGGGQGLLGVPSTATVPQISLKAGSVVLNGILADLVDVLRLPLHILVGQTNSNSHGNPTAMLAQAVAWYMQFLSRKNIQGVHIGYVPVTRRDGAEDGAVSLSENDFFATVVNAVETSSLMLVGFDVNRAHNVNVVTEDSTHFAVVVGVDVNRGVVKLADVSVKKYRKVWHLPLMRLYTAVIGCGYMVVSGSAVVASTSGGLEKAKGLLTQARFKLPPPSSFRVPSNCSPLISPNNNNGFFAFGGAASFSSGTGGSPMAALLQGGAQAQSSSQVFEYPRKNYSVTVLASVLSQLGFPTSVEDLCYGSGFHVSFLLSEHIPMLDAMRILSYYSHVKLGDEVAILATTLDSAENLPVPVFAAMLKGAVHSNSSNGRNLSTCISNPQLLQQSSSGGIGDVEGVETGSNTSNSNAPIANPLPPVEPKSIIIVAYDIATIQKDPAVWNGSFGGSYAQVIGFDNKRNSVLLVDSNPESYFRQWECPVALLHEACCQKDRITDRARGFLRLTRQRSDAYVSTKQIDLRRAMVYHPFKVPISSAGSAIALAFSELSGDAVSCEDVLYASRKFSLSKLTTTMTSADVIELISGFESSQANINNKKYTAKVLFKTGNNIKLGELEAGVDAASSMDLVLYDVSHLWGEAAAAGSGQHQGAGIISHAVSTSSPGGGGGSNGVDPMIPAPVSGSTVSEMPMSVVVMDGSPTRFGASWRVGIDKLQASVTSIIRLEMK